MGIGEGLLNGLLGGVAGGSSEVMRRNQSMDKEDEIGRIEALRAENQANRERAMIDYKVAKENEQRSAMSKQVNDLAGLLAAERKVTSPEVDAQAGAAANAYNGALQRGDITEQDATNAANAITEYSDRNATPDTNITTKDRVRATAELDSTKWKDVAALEGKDAALETRMKIAEMQNALGLQRMDMQTQVAVAKMEAAYSKLQNGSKDPADVQTMRFALDEINKSRSGEGKPSMSLEELLRSGLLGKSGEGSTETVKTDDSGMVLERTVTNRVKGGAGGGTKFTSRAEYDKLPVGATYTGPDGKQYKKGK